MVFKEKKRRSQDTTEPEPSRIEDREEWASTSTLVPSPEFEEQLRTENDAMKKQMHCKVCFTNDVGVVFLPCGHLVVCTSCAPSLQTCVICRRKINETIKIYMS